MQSASCLGSFDITGAQMFRSCPVVKHRMAPPAQSNAKQHGYVPLRAASPPRDSSTSREYPLNRRVSPGVEHRRPAPRGNPKGVGKTTIAPGQVGRRLLLRVFNVCTYGSCFPACVSKPAVTSCKTVLQPAPGPRVKDKFVSLPDELEDASTARQNTIDLPATVFEVGVYAHLAT